MNKVDNSALSSPQRTKALRRKTEADRMPERGDGSRRDEIIRCAGELFSEKGYNATTLEDIAARVGLLAGSLYYYIKSKEDLLYEFAKLLGNEIVAITAEIPPLRESAASIRFEAFLDRCMSANIRLLAGYSYITSPQFTQHDLQFLDPEHLSEITSKREAVQSFIRDILKQGIDEGSFDPVMNPSVVGHVILRFLWSTTNWYDRSGAMSIEELAGWYKRSLIRSVSNVDLSFGT